MSIAPGGVRRRSDEHAPQEVTTCSIWQLSTARNRRRTGPAHPSGTAFTVRASLDGAPLITDGPFAETSEVLGGYYLLEAETLDDVIELAREIPAAQNVKDNGAVEVRPAVMSFSQEASTTGTRYLALIHGKESAADIPDSPEWEAGAAEHGAFMQRHDEAIRLARLLVELLPDQPEVNGLLALLLLQDSRRRTRLSEEGELVRMQDQERRGWDQERIAEGVARLATADRLRQRGTYELQAEIAAVHAQASTWGSTDWPEIARLYGELALVAPSPVVELNRAVAVAHAEGPAAGLKVLEAVADDTRLSRSHLLFSTRAELLRRLGRIEEAIGAYHRALRRARTDPERAFLQRRLTEVTGN